VWLSEHHFIDDGYLPSISPAAAAIAARTKRIRIASGVLLMPFHHPVRLAEDIAVVDVLSGGRFELGVGFKPEEFAGFGVPFTERGARTNEALAIIRRLLRGERVSVKSDFFDFQNIKVTPEPLQKPHPPIWLGGFTLAAVRRAVRFGDGFTMPGANREVYDRYVAALQQEHRPTENMRFASGFWCLLVSDDPEKRSPRLPTTSSIKPTITRHGSRRPDLPPLPRIWKITNNYGRAGCSRSSIPTRRSA
jgi:alkanesulfonate monooxygenase SsuD/methylene tetrahydromethanopterin reductase-like flavin-dependent oxidoreductase (luciferase family)